MTDPLLVKELRIGFLVGSHTASVFFLNLLINRLEDAKRQVCGKRFIEAAHILALATEGRKLLDSQELEVFTDDERRQAAELIERCRTELAFSKAPS